MLAGRTILITRSGERSTRLVARLEERGATVLVTPATTVAAGDCTGLDAAVARLAWFDWIVVTSVNTVTELQQAAQRVGTDVVAVPVRWAVVGPATRRALSALGVRVDLEPAEPGTAGLVATLTAHGASGRALLPHSDLAGSALADALTGMGFDVEAVVAYRTVPVPFPTAVEEAWGRGEVDLVVLAAGSAARQVAQQLGARPDVAGVAIGEPTALVARDLGLRVDAVAQSASDDALATAIEQALNSQGRHQRAAWRGPVPS